ncbi:MAG: hypothetical protein ACO1N6_10045 [Microcella sp.]
MKQTDAVWRTLVDHALDGRREWPSTAELAWHAGVGQQLAYKALARPIEIGAVTRHRPPAGGFSVTDTERVLTLFAVSRTLREATATTLEAAHELTERVAHYAVGGTRAAVHHLDKRNTIADHGAAILYVPTGSDLTHLPDGDSALVSTIDIPTLEVWGDGYTSRAQTYADLFAQPGWQASEFRRALWRRWFSVDDWSRGETASG